MHILKLEKQSTKLTTEIYKGLQVYRNEVFQENTPVRGFSRKFKQLQNTKVQNYIQVI